LLSKILVVGAETKSPPSITTITFKGLWTLLKDQMEL
jgi:hypothetical protein